MWCILRSADEVADVPAMLVAVDRIAGRDCESESADSWASIDARLSEYGRINLGLIRTNFEYFSRNYFPKKIITHQVEEHMVKCYSSSICFQRWPTNHSNSPSSAWVAVVESSSADSTDSVHGIWSPVHRSPNPKALSIFGYSVSLAPFRCVSLALNMTINFGAMHAPPPNRILYGMFFLLHKMTNHIQISKATEKISAILLLLGEMWNYSSPSRLS